VPIVLKCGILNFLEPSGPVQACNGIALLLPIYVYMYIYTVYIIWKLREERRMRLFKNWVLRRIFGSKRQGNMGV
jgi:hypothetical protein